MNEIPCLDTKLHTETHHQQRLERAFGSSKYMRVLLLTHTKQQYWEVPYAEV